MGLVSLQEDEETPEIFLHMCAEERPREDIARGRCLQARKRPFARKQHWQHLDLQLPDSRIVRKQNSVA